MSRSACLVFSFALFALQCIAQAKPGLVSLHGKLKNFTNQVEVEDLSEFQYLLPSVSAAPRVFVPDSAGAFKLSFSATAPNYYRLGRNILYLTPGDNMEVYLDKSDPRTATFKGRGSEANLYLRNTPFPKGGSFIEAGRLIKTSPELTMEAVLQAGQYRTKQLDSAQGISAEFRRLETARIRADIINSLNSGYVYSNMKFRFQGDSAQDFMTKYWATVQPTIDNYAGNFVDPSLMKMVVYRDLIEDVLKHEGKTNDKQILQDWQKASGLTEEIRKVSDKAKLKNYQSKIDAIATTSYRKAVNASLQSLLKFGKGDVARDFAALDIKGNKIKLSDLKGKIVYLDLWATWCGPCMAEMPNYEKLKEKYKDNKEIAFVSLSIDDNEGLWKNNVATREAQGLQWFINRNALTDYEIVSIPRTIIIDRDFRVVDLNAPLPSQKTTIEILDGLTGKL